MVSSGLLRRVALVRTDVSEEPGASFIRVTKIGDLEQHKLQLATDVLRLVPTFADRWGVVWSARPTTRGR
jgi:hypothetical protein